jgi:hypothetical protein
MEDLEQLLALDRGKVIFDTRSLLKRDYSHLGEGQQFLDANAAEWDEILKKCEGDEVSFSASPVVYPIDINTYKASQTAIPDFLAEQLQRYDYYWMTVPVFLSTSTNWPFANIIVVTELYGDGEKDRPKAFRIFPDQRFHELFRAELSSELGLDSALNFSLPQLLAPGLPPVIFKSFSAPEITGKLTAKLILPPVSISITRALIKNQGTDTEKIKWEFTDASVIKTEGLKTGMVIQAPKGTMNISVKGWILARRNNKILPGPLVNLLNNTWQKFSDGQKKFFENGMPIGNKVEWNDILKNIQ